MLIIMAIKLDATIQQGLVSFAEHHKNFFIYHCKKCIRSYYTKQTIKVCKFCGERTDEKNFRKPDWKL
jgi:rRNA maturation endonuclease Nob1